MDFIYLSEKEREREHKQGEQQVEGEAGSPLSRDPNAGLDPRILISWRAEGRCSTDWATQVPLE